MELNPAESPSLYGLVLDLAGRVNLPVPRIFTIPEEAPKARVAILEAMAHETPVLVG